MPAKGSVHGVRRASCLLPFIAMALAGCRDDTGLPISPVDDPVLADVEAQAIEPDRMAVGFFHSCLLTKDGRAYCWGDNDDGQIDDGTAWPPVLKRLKPVAVATDRRFDHLVTGNDHTCGIASTPGPCAGDGTRPVRSATAAPPGDSRLWLSALLSPSGDSPRRAMGTWH